MALPIQATVMGTFLDGNGNPTTGFVVFSSNLKLTNSITNETISPLRIKAKLDENGEISELLYVTDDTDWNPVDWVWTVREVIDGRPIREYNIQLPSNDLTVHLEDLAPAVVNDPQYESYALADHTHAGGGSGAVESVNGETGEVVLDYVDVGAASSSHNHNASYAALVHTHDDRYFTESEVTTSLAGKSDTSHNHDASYATTAHTHDTRYYTETETDSLLTAKSDTSHTHDTRYYTETEVDTALAGKSSTSHNHDGVYATAGHNHDANYYTESEVDTALAGKASTSHNHDSTYYTESEVNTLLDAKANDPHSHTSDPILRLIPNPGNRWFVTDDPFDAGFTAQLDTGDRFTYPDGHASERETYLWNGSTWVFELLLDDIPSVVDAVIAATTHVHSGSDITTGTVATARLSTGTGSSNVALGDHNHSGTYANATHNHAASDVNSGTLDIARVPTGTSGTTVALGNHTHTPTSASVTINATANTYHGTPTVYDLGNGWVAMDGGIESTGTNNAGSTLVTIPSGYRPATAKQFTIRHTGTSASTGTISMTTGGLVSYNSAFSSGSQMDFVGLQWPKA